MSETPAAPLQDDELVRRLLARNVFWINGSRWMMGENPDPDCHEAAARITFLQKEAERLEWLGKKGLWPCTPEHTWAEWTKELAADADRLRSDLAKARSVLDKYREAQGWATGSEEHRLALQRADSARIATKE